MNKTTTALILFASIFGLSGCAQQRIQQALDACPNPAAINVQAPDFMARSHPKAVEAFYGCQIAILSNDHTPNIIRPNSPIGQMRAHRIPSLDDLQYQQTLWRQVFKGQKTPEDAQEAWLLWQQRERATSAAMAASAPSPSTDYSKPPMTCMSMGPNMMQCQ